MKSVLGKRFVVLAVVLAVAATGLFLAVRQYLPAVLAPFGPAPADITRFLPEDSMPAQAVNETNLPLKLPPGFSISLFAKDLPGARVMRFDGFGNLWISRTSEGVVTLLEIDRESGKVRNQSDIFIGLRKPHGLAFDPKHQLQLYVAEEHRIRRFATYSEDPGEEILSLPAGDGHFTRTIGFGPASAEAPAVAKALAGRPAGKLDQKLYISIGSSCNVCRERDERRAAILRYDTSSGKSEIFARGLRNAVFFAWHPVTKKLWATEMGRDWLGDELPPDEINIVEEGKDYGWPTCYGKNAHDTDFDTNTYIRAPCTEPFETPSFIDIPAHSAPLGLAFIPPNPSTPNQSLPGSDATGQAGSGQGWPEEYWYDLLVAYHGSWNRSQPTGYKVVRHKFDADGTYRGVDDFITGWLTPEGALGRPADILIQPDGAMYLSDDKAGVIYEVLPPPRA